MMKRPLKTMGAAAVLLTAVGAGIGFAAGSGGWAIAQGAGIGLGVALASCIHFGARTMAGRTAEASGPEFSADSVERRVFAQALAGVGPDALTVLSLSTVVCLAVPDAIVIKAILVCTLLIVVGDLAVRVRRGWRQTVGPSA